VNRHINKFHRDIRDIHTQGEVAAHEPHALFKKEKKVSNWKPISLSLLLTVGFTLLHEFLLAGVFLALAIGLTIHEYRSLNHENG